MWSHSVHPIAGCSSCWPSKSVWVSLNVIHVYTSDIPIPHAFINLSVSKRGFSSAYILLNSKAMWYLWSSFIAVKLFIRLAVFSKCFLVIMFLPLRERVP